MTKTTCAFPGMIDRVGREALMITTSFDHRTYANMEVALQRACDQLPGDRNGHSYRRFVAQRIIDCAENESRTLTSLSQAGYRAVVELCVAREGKRILKR